MKITVNAITTEREEEKIYRSEWKRFIKLKEAYFLSKERKIKIVLPKGRKTLPLEFLHFLKEIIVAGCIKFETPSATIIIDKYGIEQQEKEP